MKEAMIFMCSQQISWLDLLLLMTTVIYWTTSVVPCTTQRLTFMVFLQAVSRLQGYWLKLMVYVLLCCNKQRWDDHHGRPSQESHSRVFPFPRKQGLQSRPGNFSMGAVYLIKVIFTRVLKIIMLLSFFILFCIPSLCDWFQMTCNLFSDTPYGPRHAKGVRTT